MCDHHPNGTKSSHEKAENNSCFCSWVFHKNHARNVIWWWWRWTITQKMKDFFMSVVLFGSYTHRVHTHWHTQRWFSFLLIFCHDFPFFYVKLYNFFHKSLRNGRRKGSKSLDYEMNFPDFFLFLMFIIHSWVKHGRDIHYYFYFCVKKGKKIRKSYILLKKRTSVTLFLAATLSFQQVTNYTQNSFNVSKNNEKRGKGSNWIKFFGEEETKSNPLFREIDSKKKSWQAKEKKNLWTCLISLILCAFFVSVSVLLI